MRVMLVVVVVQALEAQQRLRLSLNALKIWAKLSAASSAENGGISLAYSWVILHMMLIKTRIFIFFSQSIAV